MSKKQELKALRAADRRKQSWITIGIIAVGALLIAGVLIWPSIQKRMVKPNPRPNADYTSMGYKNAKVKVEEFSDFQCPYCKQFATKLEPAIVEKYVTTGKIQVIVGMGTCGIAAGARDAMKTILDVIEKDNLSGVLVTQTGCIGVCEKEPIVQVTVGDQPKVVYGKVSPEIAARIIKEHVEGGKVVESNVVHPSRRIW
jgi:NADP-reducing hydrogenase subunit HndB